MSGISKQDVSPFIQKCLFKFHVVALHFPADFPKLAVIYAFKQINQMGNAFVNYPVGEDLVEITEMHPIYSAVIVIFILWIGYSLLRWMRRNYGSFWSPSKQRSVERPISHNVVVDLPRGKQLGRWKKHGHVHTV